MRCAMLSRAALTLPIAALAAWTGLPTLGIGAEEAIAIQQDNTTAKVVLSGQTVLEYRFADVPKKPYVSRLLTPRGINVLRDSPADHKHHHGLMFAVAVDGVDFWSENERCGRQESRGIAGAVTTTQPGGSRAQLIDQLAWVGPQSGGPLMLERRTICVGRSKDGRATLVTWQARLEPPPGKPKAVLAGSHYFGLGMRFLASMDSGGHVFNAEDRPGQNVRGTEQLTPARWVAYTASADGKPVTAALLDAPTNPRHPARMFTMTNPFAYLSATLDLAREPLEIQAGKPVDLCYGVALWDGHVGPAEVRAAYEEWLAQIKLSPP